MAAREIFTLEEAEKNGLEWLDWRCVAVQKGQYIKSDDNYVVRVKNRYDLTNSRGYPSVVYHTVAGQCYPTGKAHFKCQDMYNGRNNVGNPVDRYRNKPKFLSERERQFLDMVIAGLSPMEAANTVFEPGSKTYAKSIVRQILRRKEAINYMAGQVKEKLEAAGLTETWWFEQVKAMISDPEVKSEVRWDMLKTTGMMHELVIAPAKTQLTETRAIYLDTDQIERLEQTDTLEITE